jgi:hypothetical protein
MATSEKFASGTFAILGVTACQQMSTISCMHVQHAGQGACPRVMLVHNKRGLGSRTTHIEKGTTHADRTPSGFGGGSEG